MNEKNIFIPMYVIRHALKILTTNRKDTNTRHIFKSDSQHISLVARAKLQKKKKK